MPFKSVWDPTTITSLSVQSWYETLRDQKELEGLIEPPTFDQPCASPQAGRSLIVLAFGVSLLIAVSLFGLLTLNMTR